MAFTIKIQGKEFTNFNSFKLNISFDSIASAFSFNAHYNPENPEHRIIFRPLTYRKVEVFADGVLMLTGVMVNHKFKERAAPQLITVSGYSVTGVFEDASIAPASYPLESINKSINDIATALIKPFGISLISNEPEANEPLEKSTAKAGDSIKNYLSTICAQKNLILTHSSTGKLIITKVKTSTVKVNLLENVEIDLAVNGQKMHSEITVMKQASSTDSNAASATVLNPFISKFNTQITPTNKFVPNYRPKVKEQSSGASIDTERAAKNVLANDLKAIKFNIKLSSWYLDNEILTPNKLIAIQSDFLFLFKKTNLFIEAVAFSGTPKAQVSNLTCVIPEVYNGNTPTNIFL